MAESIAAALGRFSEFLGQEEQRVEAEEQKDRQRIASQRISDAFTKISPLHDEEDARRIMLETISDASALEVLDTQLPLIQGLYNDSITAIKNYRAKREDEILKEFTVQEGYEGPEGLQGGTQLDLLKFQQSREISLQQTEASGQVHHRVYDRKGEIRFEKIIDARTDQQKQDADLDKIRVQEQVRASFRSRADFRSYAGTTPEGLPISFDASTGFFNTPYTADNGEVTMRRYGGGVVRGTKGSLSRALEEQKLWKDIKKSAFVSGNDKAAVIMSKLNIPLPIESTGKGQQGSYLSHLGSMDKDKLEAAIQQLDVKDRAEIREQLTSFDEDFITHQTASQEVNKSSDIISYEQALKTFKLTPQDFNTYYNYAEEFVTSSDPKLTKTREYIKSEIARRLNLEDSEVKTLDETGWTKKWNLLNNKDKGALMKWIRDRVENKES